MALGHWLKDYIGPKASAGGVDIPTPTIEDAGKSIVVNDEGQYELSSAGGGGTALIVNVNTVGSDLVLDRTWQEIHDAFIGGRAVIIHLDVATYNCVTDIMTQTNPGTGATTYVVSTSLGSYETNSADDYPKNNPFG